MAETATGFTGTLFGTTQRSFTENETASSGFVTRASTGEDLLYEFAPATPPYSDPLTAFNAWKAILGVGENAISGVNNGLVSVSCGSNFFQDAASTGAMKISSEGGVSFRRPGYDTATSSSDHPITLSGGSSQYALSAFRSRSMPTVNAASLILSFKEPSTAMGFVSGKRSVSGTTQLYYLKWSELFFSTQLVTEVAIRLQPGIVEIMVLPASDVSGAYFQVFRTNDSRVDNYAVDGNGAYTAALTASTNAFYVSTAPTTPVATGFSSTQFGRPERVLPLYITNYATGAAIVPTFIASTPAFADADTAYAAWLAELGVSDSLLASSVANTAVQVLTQTPTLLAGTRSYLSASATGGLAFYAAAPASFSPTGYALAADTVFGQFNIPDFWVWPLPSLAVSFSPPADEMTLSEARSALDATSGHTVGRFTWTYASLTIKTAARFSTGKIVLITTVSGSGNTPYFQVFRFDQAGADLSAKTSEGTYVGALSIGATTQYESGLSPQSEAATGFSSTTFGATAWSRLVTGFKPTAFGTAIGRNTDRPDSIHSTVFGHPHWPHLVTALPQGQMHTKFSTPGAQTTVYIPQPYSAYAWGTSATVFGAPTAAYRQEQTATGGTTTSIGGPASRTGGTSTGTNAVAFGTPVSAMRGHAAGWRATVFGVPVANGARVATGLFKATRWGLPKVYRPDTYPARGFTSTRFGRAAGFTRFNYSATGFVTGAFGTPLAAEAQYATAIAPGTNFGTPLLIRALLC